MKYFANLYILTKVSNLGPQIRNTLLKMNSLGGRVFRLGCNLNPEPAYDSPEEMLCLIASSYFN